jgi:HlyD family secretion protein
MKTFFSVFAVLAILAAGAGFYLRYAGADSINYFRTTPITRGDLLSTINATGTVEPEERVDVGAQIVGRIARFGVDLNDPAKKKTVDYNSVVHEGQILAVIDDAIYSAQVDQAKAALAHSKATLLQLEAVAAQTEKEFKRAQMLLPQKAIAQTDYDLDEANATSAKANVAVGKAAIQQDEALLRLAQTNLNYTVIRSPVEGTIVARRVDVGQTVVTGLNAPSLFLIAKDLRKMQVWASVNEIDIGRIKPGMAVRFTVDAHPKDVFHGTVEQVRLNAATTQNVVTYTVVVGVDNKDLRLLPYLTANVWFEVEQRHDVLMVPNAALRWKPRTEQIALDARRDAFKSMRPKSDPNDLQVKVKPAPVDPKSETKNDGHKGKDGKAEGAREHGQVWVKDGNFVRPVSVRIGPSDGLVTEISGVGDQKDKINDKVEVVVGETSADQAASEDTNPFGPPKIFGGRGSMKGMR